MDTVSIIKKVLDEAGAVLREGFDASEISVSHKGRLDMVTEWDMKVEALTKRLLGELSPGSAILGEETGGADKLDGTVWLIDPLDGTTNFVHRLPHFCISLACVHDNEVVAGGIYAPVTGQIYLAEKGQGAERNGKRLQCASVARLDQSLLATGFPYDREKHRAWLMKFLGNAVSHMQGIRRLGSAALDLCMVAEGIYGVYIEKGIHAWDIAAGVLMVQEAGGRVSMLDGSPLDFFGREIVAASAALYGPVMHYLLEN